MRRLAIAAVAGFALAGCSTGALRGPAPEVPAADAAAAQAGRVAWLEAHPDWSLEGRVAIRKAGRGGSGRIDWQQAADTTIVSLGAPVTRQSWRLTAAADGARLEGLDGGARAGPDAEALLREATGWDIPVSALGRWAQGRAAGGAGDMTFDAAGHPATLVQDGWTIRYADWRAGEAGRPALPGRVDAERDDARVRLLVDDWRFDGTP